MKRLLFLSVPLLTLLMKNSPSNAQVNLNGSPIDTVKFASLLRHKMDSLKIPGAALVLLEKGKLVYRLNLGYADLVTKKLVSDNTVFEAASMTKPLFAFYVMMLVRKGKIDLDRPLYRYLFLPDLDYDPRYKSITARMVLSHTSGLPNWRADNRGQELDIKSEPGMVFAYSGEGYDYLAKVIAKLQKTNLVGMNKLIRRDLLLPAGMAGASLLWCSDFEHSMAIGYENGRNAREVWKPKVVNAASSLFCTAGDYAAFLSCLFHQKLLDTIATNQLLSKQVALPKDHVIKAYFGWTDWTLGFAVLPSACGDLYAHGGTNEDFQSNFLLDQQSGNGYVLMTNSNSGHELNKVVEGFLLGTR